MKWKVENEALVREIRLANFVACVDLLNEITIIAEEEQHHPDVQIYRYNKMKIILVTHDQGKITEKDWFLAKKIDELYNSKSK